MCVFCCRDVSDGMKGSECTMAMYQVWCVVSVCLTLAVVRAELPEQDCPDDCDCHYFRINWVTDCSESNLTTVPTEEEGLSLNVYILNMNANNMQQLEPFPADLKVKLLCHKCKTNRCMSSDSINSQTKLSSTMAAKL